MPTERYVNAARSKLAAGITNSQTTITVTTGHGVKFPAGNFFLTASNTAGTYEVMWSPMRAVLDTSGAGRNGTLEGSVLPLGIASPWSGFGYAAAFDGIPRGLTNSQGISVSSTGLMPTTAMTYRCKFRKDRNNTGANNVAEVLMGTWDAVTGIYVLVGFIYDSLYFFWQDNASAQQQLPSPAAVSEGLHEMEMSFTGGLVRMFIDGTLVATSGTTTLKAPTTVIPPFIIGKNSDANGPYPFKGVIDSVEIANVARHTANYTPSSTPWTADANSLLLWHFEGDTFTVVRGQKLTSGYAFSTNDDVIHGALAHSAQQESDTALRFYMRSRP